MASVWVELKRRNVVRVAVAYAIAAWILIEITATTFPILKLPDWSVTLVTVLVLIGFPLALIFAWAFELTPEGLKREKDIDRSQSITRSTGRRLDFVIIAVLVLALSYFAFDKFVLDPARDAELVNTTTEAVGGRAAGIGNAVTAQISIAVLPFANMSSDPEQKYFSDGISEEILNRMIHLSGIRVISRNSSFAYKESPLNIRDLGRRLGADYILQGSVRRAGNVVRISVRLTRTSDGTEIWVNSYDRELANILSIQDEIAVSAINEFAPNIMFEPSIERDIDPNAYEAYLRGNDYYYRGLGDPSIVLAVELYERAVALDPLFVHGHAALSKARSRMIYQGLDPTGQLIDAARESAETALRLDEDLAASMAAMGWYYYWALKENGTAIKWFEPALAKLPNDSELLLGLGLAERRLAHWDDALKHLLLSFDLDPLSNEKAIEVGISYAYKHDYIEAVEYFEAAITLAPDQYRSYAQLAEGLIGRDASLDGALQTFRKGGDVIGRNEFIRRMLSPQVFLLTQMLMLSAFPVEFEELELESLTRNQAIFYLLLSAEQHRREGRTDAEHAAAETLLGLLGDESGSIWAGMAYAHLDRREEAVRLLAISPESINSDARTYQSKVMVAAYGQLVLGNQDAAIERLDHALSVPGPMSIAMILVSPLWLDLRYHTSFQSLLSKYGH
jgi:TolB-like protein